VTQASNSFNDLGLPDALLRSISELGYEHASPIQEQAIPTLMQGRDVLGQAQTGTGKTAAFALPILAQIDPKNSDTQVLVLAPTRELAIQVSEAFESYSKYLNGVNVLSIYGGQAYGIQLKQLKRGAQIVVGTPGRVMDHMRRGSLKINNLKTLVLDEADEMLRMGFIDDVNWVLEHTPDSRQIALFSATMPKEIKRVADQHLNDPALIKIASKNATASTVRQRYWMCKGLNKLDAFCRIFEVEQHEGVIVFVRTKVSTEDISSKLRARGFSATALNGDIPQAAREKTVDRLKKGDIDILVATDVVARGLDVERISHVVNFDIPYDTEAYVHRIGRTGRAGRSGEAILFVAPREQRMLRSIEKVSGKTIERMEIPSAKQINELRIEQFNQQIMETVEAGDLSFYQDLVDKLIEERQVDPAIVAAALAKLSQGGRNLLIDPREDQRRKESERPERKERSERPDRGPRERKEVKEGPIPPLQKFPDVDLKRYKIQVGHMDQVKPGQIVAAIANAADLSSDYIGQIEIYDTMTTVDLPDGMPKALLKTLQKTRVAQRPMKMVELSAAFPQNGSADSERKRPAKRQPRKRESRDN
jgi:ATP-dependent RNA helicase DeaD